MDSLTLAADAALQTADLGMPIGRADFSVHGVLGLRLINASPVDAASVVRQFGGRQGQACTDPDIVLTFVKRLPGAGLQRIGSAGPAVDRDGRLVVQRGPHRAAIDLGGIGKRCEILCETGIGAVPLLESIADVALLAKGYAPLHAAAFVHNNKTIVASGWNAGGKSTALLAFAGHGASYISDDRVWIRRDGEHVYGFSAEMTPQDWQLRQLPRSAAAGTNSRRAALFLLRRVEALTARHMTPLLPSTLLDKVARHLRRRLLPQLRPEQLFERTLTGSGQRPGALFVMLRREAPKIDVERLSLRNVVTRVLLSVQHDQRELFDHYRALRFAAPQFRNRYLESAAALQHEILCSALRGTRAYLVRHPPQGSLSELYQAMEPYS